MINIDNDYMINLRREIHMYPEVDYDLPKTVALIKRELEAMGIDAGTTILYTTESDQFIQAQLEGGSYLVLSRFISIDAN